MRPNPVTIQPITIQQNTAFNTSNTVIMQRNKLTGLITWVLTLILLVNITAPALAHHPFGGTTPSTWIQGFLSGIGHPVIGPDHFVFTIVVGLLATRLKPAWAVPVAFLAAALGGTGLHLMEWDLPAPEFIISLSVLVFGILAAYGRQLDVWIVVVLGAIAGIFHGYAYGEAVVGAEMTPLFSYLAGFTLIQAVVIGVSASIVQKLFTPANRSAWLRYAGFIACGVGGAFLSSLILG